MKLRHKVYESVSVKGKHQYHQFFNGILEIEDKDEIKELLKNKNIEEVKEETETPEGKPAGEDEK